MLSFIIILFLFLLICKYRLHLCFLIHYGMSSQNFATCSSWNSSKNNKKELILGKKNRHLIDSVNSIYRQNSLWQHSRTTLWELTLTLKCIYSNYLYLFSRETLGSDMGSPDSRAASIPMFLLAAHIEF